MKKKSEEMQRLATFIEDNIPVEALQKVKFFLKGTRRKDYEKIAARICWFFGFKSIYEYKRPRLSHKHPTVISGKYPDEINKKGNITAGAVFHIDAVETAFTCPICECEQDATESAAYNNPKACPAITIKCKGCKRKLILFNDIGGNLTVSEKA